MKALYQIARKLFDRVAHPIVREFRSDSVVNRPHRIFGAPEYHTFIGYYDIQPFNTDETRLLAGRCSSSHVGPAMATVLEIGYFDIDTGLFNAIDQTNTWCWQMGCRLQWVMLYSKEHILYNTVIDGQSVTAIYDPDLKRKVSYLDDSTYCISPDGQLRVTLDFENLERCRAGYGYNFHTNRVKFPPEANTALTIISTFDGKKIGTVNTDEIRDINPHPSMDGRNVFHYFNHAHFSPNSMRLLVFHIWDDGHKRRVRMITMDPNGKNIIDITNGLHVSHYWWLDNKRILIYGTDPIRGLGYHIYDQSGTYLEKLEDTPNLDGHPHSLNSSNWFICDTVVNKYYERKLWLYDLKKHRRKDLAKFYSPPKFKGENRCDLHPRLSPSGKFIAIDSAHTGYRQIIAVNLDTP